MFRPQWDQYAYWMAIGGLVAIAIYTLSQWREIGRALSNRETRFSMMSVVSVLAVLAILVGLNYLVIRRDKRWDLTATKSFSLSDETTKVLNNLKAPVKVTVYDQPAGFPRFRDALTPYEFASKNVSVEYVDADRQPARVKEDDVLNYGTVVLDYQGRKEHVMSDREQEITNALVKVTTGRTVKAYFIEGHGEKASTGVERTGYSSALDVLKRDNFTVDKLVLAQTPEVPGRCVGDRHRLGRRPTSCRLKPTPSENTCRAAARRCSCWIRRWAQPLARSRCSKGCSRNGASRWGTTWCST